MVLLANRTVVPSLKSAAIFWAFQAVTVGAAGWFAWRGLDGLDRVPIAKWVVAGLLVFHAVQNYVVRQGGRKI
jgi:hypothetical protein